MNLNSNDPSIYYPDESLEEKFENGELATIQKHLNDFIERHKSDIKKKVNEKDNPNDFFTILYQEIDRRGSIHIPSEMADQIKEINKEIWYRGEDGATDRRVITEEWTQRYSIMWRQARKKEILFVLRKCKDDFLALIND
jgi:hypothetical protein